MTQRVLRDLVRMLAFEAMPALWATAVSGSAAVQPAAANMDEPAAQTCFFHDQRFAPRTSSQRSSMYASQSGRNGCKYFSRPAPPEGPPSLHIYAVGQCRARRCLVERLAASCSRCVQAPCSSAAARAASFVSWCKPCFAYSSREVSRNFPSA